MSEMPWVRFFPSDWLAGTRGMSAAETGIYITLIASMYERGEPVPEDTARLARLCGASNAAFKTALETLVAEGKIKRVDGGLWNERVGKESEVRAEKSEVGRSAANARWSQKDKKNNAADDANALPTHSGRNANQKPDTRSQIERKREPDGSPKSGKASRLPDDWTLPSEWRDLAMSMGLPENRVSSEADKMRDWSRSSKNGAKLDWLAAWRSWVRRIVEENPQFAAVPTKADPNLVSLAPDHPDFKAVERLRGKRVEVFGRGTATFEKSEIAAARKAMARGDELPLEATGPP